MPITAKEIEYQNFIQKGYYAGLCDFALDKIGITAEKRCDFLMHPDVKNWESSFLLAQVLQYVSGVRDERLHDITCSTLGYPPSEE